MDRQNIEQKYRSNKNSNDNIDNNNNDQTQKKKYECDYCDHSTNDKTAIRWHIAIHTNDRPYSLSSIN